MVSIGGFALMLIVGLLSMAVIASVVSALRKYLEPEKPENYYAIVGGLIMAAGVALIMFSPPPTTAVGLLTTFGGWFGFLLSVLYAGLAVYHGRGMADDGDDRSGGRDADRGRDRPLSQR